MDSANPRGALWNRWDPHIHAPGTILSDQYKGSGPWEEFLSRIEKSDPTITALGITDYYSIAVYEQVLEKQRGGRLSNVGLIFPNVEMRFVSSPRKVRPSMSISFFRPRARGRTAHGCRTTRW